MILSGASIQKLLKSGELTIVPEPIIKEASVKLHIDKKITIQAKEFVIAQTKEKITLPVMLAGLYDGYTHLSRKGIITHMGSMFVDPGSDSHITLEIFNASDNEVTIEANERVGHLVLLEVK